MVARYGRYWPVMALTASKTASCTIAAYRAWANGFAPFAIAVSTAMAFQSRTTSALASADANKRTTNAAIHRRNPVQLALAEEFESTWTLMAFLRFSAAKGCLAAAH